LSDRVENRRLSFDDFRHEALGTVGSTNAECLDRARAGDAGNLWITATAQSGGRGRRGRAWTSEPGNLYASLLLIDAAPLQAMASLPLAVAIAVHDAIRAVMPAGAPPVEIKWPNDILVGRAKTCGILLEAERLADGRHALVIGIGINIASAPDQAAYRVTKLGDHAPSVSPDILFARLYAAMVDALALWDRGAGIADVVRRWRASACGIGERITVNLPDRSLSGYFAGIDDQGLLLLEEDNGRRTAIAAGDVFFV